MIRFCFLNILNFGNLCLTKRNEMPIVSSTIMAIRITIITNNPQSCHKVTDCGYSHMTTHITYLQYNLMVLDI